MDYQKTVRYSKILRTMLVVALAGCLLVVLVGAGWWTIFMSISIFNKTLLQQMNIIVHFIVA